MDRTITYSALCILALAGLGFAFSIRSRKVEPASSTRAENVASATIVSNAAPSPRPITVSSSQLRESTSPIEASSPPPTNETLALDKLRDLSTSTPLLALRLAREGNARDPKGTEAPGRAWVIVKSLTNLGRFDEAREEARQMVEAYPNTPDALDVERHVLVHPAGPPVTTGE